MWSLHTCGLLVFIIVCRFNDMESIYTWEPVKCGHYKQVVLIHRWSIEQVWLYHPVAINTSSSIDNLRTHQLKFLKRAYVVTRGILIGRGLDRVGHEAQNGANPQQDGESSEQLLAELDPLRGSFGWTQLVGTISLKYLFSPLWAQSLDRRMQVKVHITQI